MKQGRTLQDVLKEVKRQDEVKRDFIAPSQAFTLAEDGRNFAMKHLETGQEEVFGTSDLFHRQVGTALDIPAKYYDLMRSKNPELLAENVNSWFGRKGQSYMVRSMDYGAGRVARALLSSRYRRIDNLEVASTVLPLFAGVPGMQVMSCEVTENRLYLKIVDTRKEFACVGDIVQAGVVISNSEVGLGAVSVQPLLYTLACTNGMIINSMAERRAHIGRASKAIESSFVVYSDEAIEAEDRALLLKLRDAAQAAFSEAMVSKAIGRLEQAAEAKITGRVQDVVEVTGKSYGLNQPEQDGILEYLIRGGDMSLYGLSNAVTRASQDVKSYDRATELETIGWQVANMPARRWKEINDSGIVVDMTA